MGFSLASYYLLYRKWPRKASVKELKSLAIATFVRGNCLLMLSMLYLLLMVALLVSSESERISDDGQEREESECP